MNKWTTRTQQNWDTIGTGIIGLGISLLMVGAVASLAFEQPDNRVNTMQDSKATQSQVMQVASAKTMASQQFASVQVTTSTQAH